eukprot:10814717-Alexandrium_andersonii.AAC.1
MHDVWGTSITPVARRLFRGGCELAHMSLALVCLVRLRHGASRSQWGGQRRDSTPIRISIA